MFLTLSYMTLIYWRLPPFSTGINNIFYCHAQQSSGSVCETLLSKAHPGLNLNLNIQVFRSDITAVGRSQAITIWCISCWHPWFQEWPDQRGHGHRPFGAGSGHRGGRPLSFGSLVSCSCHRAGPRRGQCLRHLSGSCLWTGLLQGHHSHRPSGSCSCLRIRTRWGCRSYRPSRSCPCFVSGPPWGVFTSPPASFAFLWPASGFSSTRILASSMPAIFGPPGPLRSSGQSLWATHLGHVWTLACHDSPRPAPPSHVFCFL